MTNTYASLKQNPRVRKLLPREIIHPSDFIPIVPLMEPSEFQAVLSDWRSWGALGVALAIESTTDAQLLGKIRSVAPDIAIIFWVQSEEALSAISLLTGEEVPDLVLVSSRLSMKDSSVPYFIEISTDMDYVDVHSKILGRSSGAFITSALLQLDLVRKLSDEFSIPIFCVLSKDSGIHYEMTSSNPIIDKERLFYELCLSAKRAGSTKLLTDLPLADAKRCLTKSDLID